MKKFKTKIEIIGVNPFVFLPDSVLISIFQQANKTKGPIPVRGKIEGRPYIQTLVKYAGHWRLYINGPMLKASQKQVGDTILVEIEFDPVERVVPLHPELKKALEKNKGAKKIFEELSPSRQKEIIRYISFLKTEESIERNIKKMIQFLLGKSRFVGRDKP